MADTIAVMNDGRIEQLGGPTDLYESPVSTFVANFLGQSNLVRARVTSRSSDVLCVDVEGRQLALSASRCAATGDDIWFGVRPEKLAITAVADGSGLADGLRGVITDTSFIGISTQYVVRLASGQDLMVVRQNDGAPILRPGETVDLTWDPRFAFGLDASQDAHAGAQVEDGDPVGVGARG